MSSKEDEAQAIRLKRYYIGNLGDCP